MQLHSVETDLGRDFGDPLRTRRDEHPDAIQIQLGRGARQTSGLTGLQKTDARRMEIEADRVGTGVSDRCEVICFTNSANFYPKHRSTTVTTPTSILTEPEGECRSTERKDFYCQSSGRSIIRRLLPRRSQVTEETKSMRLALNSIERWHEPLVVGAAVALACLAYLQPPTLAGRITERPAGVTTMPPRLVSAPLPQDGTRDQAYFRQLWQHETANHYALNPPRDRSAPPSNSVASRVVTAAAEMANEATDDESAVMHPPDTVASAVATQLDRRVDRADRADRRTAATPVPLNTRRWNVLTCLAGGLLASIVFAMVWPAAPQSDLDPPAATLPDEREGLSARPQSTGLATAGDPSAGRQDVAIRLPSAWVRVRPTTGETLRRAVLGGSYLVAMAGAWQVIV